MKKRFEEQLQSLNEEIAAMGALCVNVTKECAKCFADTDESRCNAVEKVEKKIDKKEKKIEPLCIKLLAQQPEKDDLKFITSALKIISDMERIGDQSFSIVEAAKETAGCGIGYLLYIKDVADGAGKMVEESIDAFIRRDGELAKKVIEYDDVVDRLYDNAVDKLIAGIHDGGDAQALTDLIGIAKSFERIGDHAVNIAERVVGK